MNPTDTRPAAQPVNREAWLTAAADALWPRIEAAGGRRPERFRVSCGWPSKSALLRASSRSRRIGEAWHAGSEDNAREVFVSPALAHPVEVLDVLAHELVHAGLPGDAGHGPLFQRVCKGAGLEKKNGKWTQAGATDELVEELKALAEELGEYPHAKLDAEVRPKQKARLMKGECPDCGYTIRLTRVWIEVGMPTCPCGAAMESVEYEAEGEELALVESAITYRTTDGRYELRTSKSTSRAGKWYVTDVETGRLTIRHSRADALAFIAAVRAGETDFPEPEAEDFDFERRDAAGARKSATIAAGGEGAMD
jgi:hypothetical protein